MAVEEWLKGVPLSERRSVFERIVREGYQASVADRRDNSAPEDVLIVALKDASLQSIHTDIIDLCKQVLSSAIVYLTTHPDASEFQVDQFRRVCRIIDFARPLELRLLSFAVLPILVSVGNLPDSLLYSALRAAASFGPAPSDAPLWSSLLANGKAKNYAIRQLNELRRPTSAPTSEEVGASASKGTSLRVHGAVSVAGMVGVGKTAAVAHWLQKYRQATKSEVSSLKRDGLLYSYRQFNKTDRGLWEEMQIPHDRMFAPRANAKDLGLPTGVILDMLRPEDVVYEKVVADIAARARDIYVLAKIRVPFDVVNFSSTSITIPSQVDVIEGASV